MSKNRLRDKCKTNILNCKKKKKNEIVSHLYTLSIRSPSTRHYRLRARTRIDARARALVDRPGRRSKVRRTAGHLQGQHRRNCVYNTYSGDRRTVFYDLKSLRYGRAKSFWRRGQRKGLRATRGNHAHAKGGTFAAKTAPLRRCAPWLRYAGYLPGINPGSYEQAHSNSSSIVKESYKDSISELFSGL